MRVSFRAAPASILAALISVAIVALAGTGCGATEGTPTALVSPLTLPRLACTRFAAPGAAPGGTGTRSSPYSSAQALADSLQPGETGCLEPGVYRESLSLTHGGTASHPVVLASAPGGRAELRGPLWVARGADWVTVRSLKLNGVTAPGLPSPQVNADHTTFLDVDVTNDHTGTCFVLGGSAGTYGVASATTIAWSRIHDCGVLPRTHLDHGIYLAHTRDVTIVDNAIYDNADWGIHLFPDAQGTKVAYNVLDGNGDGLIFAGTSDMASSGNYVTHNVIANAVDDGGIHDSGNNYGYLVTSFWGDTVGHDNVLEGNCFWQGAAGAVNLSGGGFLAFDNRFGNPDYADAGGKDFRVGAGSPCAGDGPRRAAAGRRVANAAAAGMDQP